MAERLILSLAVLTLLPGGLAWGETDPKIPNAISVIQLDLNDEEAAKELVTWEVFKLGIGKKNRVLQIPPDSKLDATLRARLKEADPDSEKEADSPLTLSDLQKILSEEKELELEDSQTLLGFLRLQASGTKLDDPKAKDLLKKSAIGELKKIATDRPSEKVKVPDAVKKTLAQGLKRALEKSEEPVPSEKELIARLDRPEDLVRALEETDADTIALEDLAELAGSSRTQGRKLRGAQFVEDVRDEARELLAALKNARTKPPGQRVQKTPFPVIQGSPSFSKSPVKPPARVARNRGFGGKSPFSGRHNPGAQAQPGNRRGAGAPGTGSVSLSGPPPVDTALTPSQESRLDRQRDLGQLSLQMRTTYANSPGVFSACQITSVNAPTPIPNTENLCKYNMATARHCVEKDGEPFSNIAIQGLENLTVTRAKADDLGSGDLAMLAVEATCKDIPFAPLALSSPRGGDGILVHANIPLKGQAETNAISNSLMMMNTNHPSNGGVNVIQGNSGGAVTNERGELVGVISSVMMRGNRQVPGIGFFATRDSLEFANAFVNPDFKPQVLGSSGRLPDFSLSQASAAEHSP